MKRLQKSGKFIWVGNWPAIDFINTQAIVDGRPEDHLKAPHDLLVWLDESGLGKGSKESASTAPSGLLNEAHAYRSLLRRGIAQLAEKQRITAKLVERTNEYLRNSVSVRRVESDGHAFRALVERRFEIVADYVAPVADSFAALLTTGNLQRIRKCKNPACVLYFYDTSKGGQRAWCSLDICGNKMRMAASRERRRLGPSGK